MNEALPKAVKYQVMYVVTQPIVEQFCVNTPQWMKNFMYVAL